MSSILGKRFVITGVFEGMKRSDIEAQITTNGGVVTDSVSTKTDYLLAGSKAGSKLDKAHALSIPVLTLEEIQAMLKEETSEAPQELATLTIEIYNRGKEVYGITFPKEDFDSEEFMEEHEDDYTELDEDSVANEIPIHRMKMLVEHNGNNVVYEVLPKEVMLIDSGGKESYRDLLNADEEEVCVVWFHGNVNTFRATWEGISTFDISNIKINFSTRIDENGEEKRLFDGIEYNGKSPDDDDWESEPKSGYDGPYILLPEDVEEQL